MATNKNDGDCTACGLSPKNCICGGHIEPAFPNEKTLGMSLRDYFAAKAMQSFILAGRFPGDIPKLSIDMSDLMLKERER